MAYETKINTTAIFPNEKNAETHPDWKGKIKIDPAIIDENGFVEIALWNATSQKGMKYLNGKVSKPFVKKTQEPAPIENVESDDLTDLPF